jgi:hypothetical protein
MPIGDFDRCGVCGVWNPVRPHLCAGSPSLSNLPADDACRPLRQLTKADVRRVVREEMQLVADATIETWRQKLGLTVGNRHE